MVGELDTALEHHTWAVVAVVDIVLEHRDIHTVQAVDIPPFPDFVLQFS